MADSGRVREALAKVQCLVVIDPFLTRTAAFADVVLPACGCFEKTQLNRAALRHNRVVLQDQILPPIGDSRPDWWIIFELARRLGLEREFPWTTVEEAIDEQLQPAGITVADLRRHPEGLSVAETAFQKFLQRGFATPSGKVELFSARLAEAGHAGVPYDDGWPADPIGFADQAAELPWIGISGPRSGRFTHSQFHRIPDLLNDEPEGRVDIHPQDAVQQCIVDGDLLRISTPRGELRLKARIWDGVPVGALLIGWGWGETDPAGNLNDLTDDHRRNAVTATPSSRTFYCRMEKVLPSPPA
jgi:anaerobic selenocysteine-containing dehydrogenase